MVMFFNSFRVIAHPFARSKRRSIKRVCEHMSRTPPIIAAISTPLPSKANFKQ
jgi:hypothetical protein